MKPHLLEVTRTARYFQLGPESGPVEELWIGLHGYAQLAARFLRWLAPLDDGATRVVAPEALSRFYLETRMDGHHGPAIGATWLTREHREADLTDHLRFLDRLAARLLSGGPDRPRVTLLGFSQGSVMATRWLVAGGLRPDRVVLWGAPLPRDVAPAQLAGALGQTPVLIIAGNTDPYATPGSIEENAATLLAAGAQVEARRYPGGHGIPAPVLLDVAGRPGGG